MRSCIDCSFNGATVPVGDPIAVLIDVDEEPDEGDKLLAQLGLGSAEQAVEVAVRSAHEEAEAPVDRAGDGGLTIGARPAKAPLGTGTGYLPPRSRARSPTNWASISGR